MKSKLPPFLKSRGFEGFAIAPTDRILTMGRTGSGKSTLLRQLAHWRFEQGDLVIVIDPKCEFYVDKTQQIVEEPAGLAKADMRVKNGRVKPIVYRPDPEYDAPEFYEAVFAWIYRLKNCVVIIDEVYAVYGGSLASSRNLRALLTRGRSMGIAVYAATQRPRNLPLEILTESEHRFVFRLDLVDDRRRAYETTAREEFNLPVPQQYSFRYHNSEMDANEPLGKPKRLEIKNRR